MLLQYLYKLLSKYILFYLNDKSNVVEYKPLHGHLEKWLQKNREKLKQTFQYKSTSEISNVKPSSFDTLILNGNFHYEQDIQAFLDKLYEKCSANSRIIICYYSALWRPVFQISKLLGISKTPKRINWFSPSDLINFTYLTDFEIVKHQQRILFPFYLPIISYLLNKYLAPLPFFRLFTLVNIAVFRPKNKISYETSQPSVSVVVAARNEEGNIENIVKRLPEMSANDELIFVEGNSTDNTWEEILRIKELYNKSHTIKALQQKGKGKGDAVREGFKAAEKDILMILDADMTVAPEELPKFYNAIITNRGEFINGSRLVYTMENKAMRFFNVIGNKFFAMAFSFVLNQTFKDTLCGTKVMSRENYLKLARNRSYFGNFDPFGDFDLIFGATKLGLKVVELPIRYKARTYGDTNIQRWKHGVILLRMLIFAARKIKFL